MEHEFWHERWRENRIGFHQADFNPMMVAHFGALGLAPGARVFLPLCGKTRDIAWLMDQGFRVAGAELSQLAIEQLFDDLGLQPEIAPSGALTRYSTPGIDMFVGDIFELGADALGPVDGTYDRAALVALPFGMRADYARHLHAITRGAPQLLIGFEYDQSQMNGPPFSVDGAEIARVYGDLYTIAPLARRTLPGGIQRPGPDGKLRGADPVDESAWLLR